MNQLILIILFFVFSFSFYAQIEPDSTTYRIENKIVSKDTFNELNKTIKLFSGGSCGKSVCGGIWSSSGKDKSGQLWSYRHIVCNTKNSYELEKIK